MDNLSDIQKTGNWGSAADLLNSNFTKIGNAITTLQYNTSMYKGLYATIEALNAAMPSPTVGMWANVGSTIPSEIYVCNTAGTWTDSKTTGGAPNTDLTPYVAKADVSNSIGTATDIPMSQKTVSDYINDLNSANGVYSSVAGTSTAGSYKSYLNNTLSSSIANMYAIDSAPFVYYRVSLTTLGDVSSVGILCVDSNDSVTGYFLKGIASTPTRYDNFDFVTPANTVKMYISYYNNYSMSILRKTASITTNYLDDTFTKITKFNDFKSIVDKIQESNKKWESYSSYTSVVGSYCTKYNTILTSSSWNYLLFNVTNMAEELRFTFQIANNVNVAGFLYRDSLDNMIGYEEVNTTGAVLNVVNYTPTIPVAATKMYVTYYVNGGMVCEHSISAPVSRDDIYPITVSISGITSSISVPYNTSEYIKLSMIGNANNLPDLRGIGIYNANNVLQRTLLTPSTDFFTAYIVEAVNNIDGDSRTDHNTGGNHLFATTSGTPTGRNVSTRFFCDGIEKTDGYRGKCKDLNIIIINNVQAFNTAKTDGTGREVIQEKISLHFSFVNNKLRMGILREAKALEDIKLGRMTTNSIMVNKYTNFMFLSDNSHLQVYNPSTSGNLYCGQGNTGAIAYTDSGDWLRTEIDRSIGYSSAKVGNNLSYLGSLKYYNLITYAGDAGITPFSAGDIIRGEAFIEFWFNS